MNIRIISRRSRAGNTYISVLWIMALAGIVLASYLAMVGTQNTMTMRSQAWNRCIAVSEAGIEEALAHMNSNGTTNGMLGRDGWYGHGTIYSKRGYIDDAYYNVAIDATDTYHPTVTSEGFAPTVQNFAGLTGFRPFLGQINTGDGYPTGTGPNYISRTVRIHTSADGMFTKGLVAKGWILLNGNGIRTDSFDSEDPLHSTNGLYSQPLAKANGDVATASGMTNFSNISAGNANIFGRVSTGPKGVIVIGDNGIVGDFAYQADPSHAGTIQPGYFTDDMNVTFPTVKDPFSGGFNTPMPGTVDGTNYNLVIGTGNWLSPNNLKYTKGDILVNGDAVWWVQGNLDFGGLGSIVIAPGASLKLYVGTQTGTTHTFSIGGNGILNGTGAAVNCQLYGLPSVRSASYSGNSTFVGTVYAPNSALSLGGGGSTIYDFMGGAVANNITLNGHFNFHYDEALGRIIPLRGYIISAWNEI